MDIRHPNEAQALIIMVYYYRDMCPRKSHILYPMKEATSGPKHQKIHWNDVLVKLFKELKHRVFDENLLNYKDWNINLTVHTYASDKNFGFVIIQNNKPIDFS